MHRILLIEDDPLLAETTCEYLQNFGFDVHHEVNGEKGAEIAIQGGFSLILLDLMLPGLDGLEVCRRVRMHPATHDVPILMLTARGDETDRIVGLELGADDYIPKPFSLRELVARIRTNLRRSSVFTSVHASTSPEESSGSSLSEQPQHSKASEQDASLTVGTLWIDDSLRTARLDGVELSLTATEFDLLWIFALHPHQVMTRERLLDQVRGREFDSFDRSIDVHISKLRKKIESHPKKPRWLQTVWGVGYRFLPPEKAET